VLKLVLRLYTFALVTQSRSGPHCVAGNYRSLVRAALARQKH